MTKAKTKAQRRHKAGRVGKPRANRTKPLPQPGDLGTSTAAARKGTEVITLPAPNPNKVQRRQRVTGLDRLERRDSLSMRQLQAAREIETAYCRVQMLSSGGELKEQVDSSPRPDAVVTSQVEAVSRLTRAMKGVPTAMRDVVEAVCWHGKPVVSARTAEKNYDRMADLKVALDLAANRLGY